MEQSILFIVISTEFLHNRNPKQLTSLFPPPYYPHNSNKIEIVWLTKSHPASFHGSYEANIGIST